MGRSFSVYLFCLAMDPLFVYLNRIPGVITVQGYIDDTTIIGNAQDPDWLITGTECYQGLTTAGFVMDQHSCFRGCLTTLNKFPSRTVALLSFGMLIGHPWATLSCTPPFGKCFRIFASQGTTLPFVEMVFFLMRIILLCVVSYEQALDFINSKSLHLMGAFAKGKCYCKSKTHVLTNYKMRPHGVTWLEKSRFGLQSLVGKAPTLGLALAGRWVFDDQGSLSILLTVQWY